MKNSLNVISEESYLSQLSDLTKKHNKELHDLKVKYLKANNPFKVGDIIKSTERGCTIKITSMAIYNSNYNKAPILRYNGTAYTSKLEPTKIPKIASIWQTDDIIKL